MIHGRQSSSHDANEQWTPYGRESYVLIMSCSYLRVLLVLLKSILAIPNLLLHIASIARLNVINFMLYTLKFSLAIPNLLLHIASIARLNVINFMLYTLKFSFVLCQND